MGIDPITIAAGAAVIGAGASIYSAASASSAARKQGAINEQISQADAAIAKLYTADQIRQRRDQLVQDVSTAAAQYSVSGVDVGSGSPLLAQAEIIRVGMKDIENLVVNGQLDVYRAQLGGSYSRSEAKSASTQAIVGGISGVANAALSYASLKYTPTPAPTTTVKIG